MPLSGPCKFNTEVFVSEVGNPCPTLGQLLASQILYALVVGDKQHEIARQDSYTELLKSWSTLGQFLANSPSIKHRRRTNVQQLTCNIDLSSSFYYLFFSFVLIELKPFVLKGKVLGEKF